MIRIILSSVFAIHGIIHLMGFAAEWGLGPGRFSGRAIFKLSKRVAKVTGILWLLACIFFLAATFAYYAGKEWFGTVAIAGLAISQTLIILYWPEAKWGTLVNLILFVTILFAAGRIRFDARVNNEINQLVSSSSEGTFVTEEKVAMLPGVVQVWLQESGVIGKAIPRTVHITQKGSMRNDIKSNWMPFDAEQYFTTDPPGFVWKATIRTNSFVDIVGRDKYENGKGNMLIKAASLITLTNSSGPEIDQGTLVRYMAEMIWFPQVAVSDYLKWEELDENHARVTMQYNGITASGIYTFNMYGLPCRFEAQRYREFKGKYSKEMWSVTTSNGSSEVTWKLKDGDFTWLKMSIVEIQYD